MIKMSLVEMTHIVNAKKPTHDCIFHGVSTDTRTLKPGNLYVAIRGEQFDGHNFINQAFEKGAVAALTEQAIDAPIPQVVVDDTIAALGQLSSHWRQLFSIPLIGVTGSNGKTTLKNMIASIMRTACQQNASEVLATEGNLNNNIGLPMTLLRMDHQHRYGVIEMGMNHFGEIAYLTELTKPAVAVITNAAEAHLEGLLSVEGVAKAKGEIFSGLNASGTAILNSDDRFYPYWKSLVPNQKQLTFGLKNAADVTATMLEQSHILLKTPAGEIDIQLPLLGTHNVMNALAATAAALAIHIDLKTIKQGLEQVKPAPGRMHQYHLANNVHVIDDTYNANPFSLQAAVTTLASMPGTKIVVLGDMKELGAEAREIHFSAGQKIRAAGIDYLFTYGQLSRDAASGFGDHAFHFTDRDQLVAELKPYLTAGTHLLVKGSRSMQMEKVVHQIVPEDQLEHAH